MIYDALYSILTADSDVTDLVSTRVYPDQAPQKSESPYIVFQKISGVPVDSHDGGSGLVFRRFQFTSYAETRLLADQIDEAVRVVLLGFSQFSPVSGTVIEGVTADGEGAGYDDPTKLHLTRSDYFIHHQVP